MTTHEELEAEAAKLYPRREGVPYSGYEQELRRAAHVRAKTISAEQVEKAAEAIALEGHNSDCFEEVRRWEQSEEWEQEAYPGEYPGMAYEDRGDALEEARAAFRAAGFYVQEAE